MRKQEYSSSVASSNSNSNYTVKKESLVDQFIDWFRNFLENAE